MSDLGGLQREIMQLVWAHAPITADEVRARLRRKLKESTIRTVLKRLEEKKFVIHRVDGRTFVYMPTSPREQAAAKAVKASGSDSAADTAPVAPPSGPSEADAGEADAPH